MLLMVGIALGVLAGYAVAIANRSRQEASRARAGSKMLRNKSLLDTWYAALAVIVVVIVLAMVGTGRIS